MNFLYADLRVYKSGNTIIANTAQHLVRCDVGEQFASKLVRYSSRGLRLNSNVLVVEALEGRMGPRTLASSMDARGHNRSLS